MMEEHRVPNPARRHAELRTRSHHLRQSTRALADRGERPQRPASSNSDQHTPESPATRATSTEKNVYTDDRGSSRVSPLPAVGL
jgi:hypothetical protein